MDKCVYHECDVEICIFLRNGRHCRAIFLRAAAAAATALVVIAFVQNPEGNEDEWMNEIPLSLT